MGTQKSPSPLGRQLKIACITARITETELAKHLGMSLSQLSHIIYGRNYLSLERAVQVRRITGMSLDELTKDM